MEGFLCHVLDPATGKSLQDFALPQSNPQQPKSWGFLGVYQDVLLGGVGFADYQARHGISLSAKDKKKSDEKDKKKSEDKEGGAAIKGIDASASQGLVGLDRHTGQVLWKIDARHSFVHNGIVAGGGLIYCLDKNPKPVEDELRRRGKPAPDTYRIVALDSRTGKTVWEVAEGIFGTFLSYSEECDLLLQAGASASDRLASEAKQGMAVYRGKDGRQQWRNDDLKYNGPCMLHHELIITNANSYSQSAGAFSLLDGSPRKIPNPLTGEPQTWSITRAYGCNNIIASENLLTFRSGAAGFYDLNLQSGTGNFGGFKSGCTSNLVVANGVLNAPDYTRTCSCAYQNQTSLAFVHMPDIEMWTVSNAAEALQPGQRIRQLGINFGAPGDRRAENGTLWVEYPQSDGKTSPLNIEVQGTPQYYRRHATAWNNVPLSWVFASGVENADAIRIPLVAGAKSGTASSPEARYRVHLYFSEPEPSQAGERVFDVLLQGKPVLVDFDPAALSKDGPSAIVKTLADILIGDVLEISMKSKRGQPILSGVEVELMP